MASVEIKTVATGHELLVKLDKDDDYSETTPGVLREGISILRTELDVQQKAGRAPSIIADANAAKLKEKDLPAEGETVVVKEAPAK